MSSSGSGAARTQRRRTSEIVTVAVAVAALDQLSKWQVEKAFQLGESVRVAGDFLRLTYVRNPGVAFGLFADLAWRWRLPFFIATLLIAAWLLYKLYRLCGGLVLARLSFGLIAGGAVGNMIDRMRCGMVVDFIDAGLGPYRFATFNVADSAISVGTVILLYSLWRTRHL